MTSNLIDYAKVPLKNRFDDVNLLFESFNNTL